jgi:hypothetical protein
MYLWHFDISWLIYTTKKVSQRPALSKYNMRPLCTCGMRPTAVNYHKNGKTFYRSQCNACLKGENSGVPKWFQAGYQQKNQCDKCGYKSPHREVFAVFHVDGNLNNCRPANLKTVCSNCARVLHKEGVRWRQGDLVPDL